MLHSKYHFALALVIVALPTSLFKVANAQMGGYAGSYGGYYTIPGSTHVPNLGPTNNGASRSSTSLDNDCWNKIYDNEMAYWDSVISKSEFNSPQYHHAKEMKRITRIKLNGCFRN
jgi:hypothetical protein